MRNRRLGSWLGFLSFLAVVTLILATFGIAPFHTRVAEASAEQAKQASPPQTNETPAPDAHAQTYEGIISDSKCGAKHAAAQNMDAATCARACAHAGEQFALVDGEKMYVLSAPTAEMERLKQVAGERAKVTGTLNGNTISVISVQGPPS